VGRSMKERPILFNAPMVRALLAGTKTQTRRIVKPQPEMNGRWMEWRNGKGVLITEQNTAWHPFDKGFRRAVSEYPHFCPYGQPGDRLWVRETFALPDRRADNLPAWVYAADYADRPQHAWKPSIHMPRTASRITLEITGIRVERLQDISEADAIAEGCENSLHLPGGRFARENYAHLWWTIHGDESWEANPWVWVVEFKRLEGGAA